MFEVSANEKRRQMRLALQFSIISAMYCSLTLEWKFQVTPIVGNLFITFQITVDAVLLLVMNHQLRHEFIRLFKSKNHIILSINQINPKAYRPIYGLTGIPPKFQT